MKKRFIIPIILFLSCTELIDSDIKFDSVKLDGGSWIQIINQNDSLEVNDINVLENNFTLEFWVSGGLINTMNSPALFMIGNDDEQVEIGVFQDLNKPDIIRVILKNNQIIEITLENIDWSNSDEYYNITFVFTNTTFEVFFNGEFITDILVGQKFDIGNNDLFIGAKGFKTLSEEPSNFWVGNFDEVRIWNKSLADYYYFEDFIKSYSVSETDSVIQIIDDDVINQTCLIGTEWDTTNTYHQNLIGFRNQFGNYTQEGCYCREIEDDVIDCWLINSVLNYHFTHSEQVIKNYGDPLLENLVSLLRFNEYPNDDKTVKDESGNQNAGKLFSLPGYSIEFIENGY